MDVDALLDSARLPEVTVRLCLRLDLVARYEELTRQIVAGPGAVVGAEGLAGAPAEGEEVAVDELADLKAQMDAATLPVTLRAHDKRSWAQLMQDCPAEAGNEDHAKAGYNTEKFYAVAIRQAIVDPPMTGGQIDKLFAVLSDPQYELLCAGINRLNVHGVSVPL